MDNPKITQAEIIAQTHIFRVESMDLDFSNGEHRTYERLVSRRPAVLIVPILNESLLLIREYSVGVERYELTFPKGLVEPKEALEIGADRELREETGYGSHQITLLRELTIVPGYMTHKTHIFLAQDLYLAPLQGDEPEPLELITWPLDNIEGLLAQPDFTEGRSVAALWLALRHLKKA